MSLDLPDEILQFIHDVVRIFSHGDAETRMVRGSLRSRLTMAAPS